MAWFDVIREKNLFLALVNTLVSNQEHKLFPLMRIKGWKKAKKIVFQHDSLVQVYTFLFLIINVNKTIVGIDQLRARWFSDNKRLGVRVIRKHLATGVPPPQQQWSAWVYRSKDPKRYIFVMYHHSVFKTNDIHKSTDDHLASWFSARWSLPWAKSSGCHAHCKVFSKIPWLGRPWDYQIKKPTRRQATCTPKQSQAFKKPIESRFNRLIQTMFKTHVL
mgnify:CR=1 FL=1